MLFQVNGTKRQKKWNLKKKENLILQFRVCVMGPKLDPAVLTVSRMLL